MKICTVILEYQNPKMTLATIASLQKAVLPRGFSHSIVVVDNSPVPDGRLAKNLKGKKGIKLITTLQNTGFARGNNLGIKYGLKQKADLFLLLNNDVIVDKNFLIYLVETIKTGADLVVPKIYFAHGFEFHKNRYQEKELGKVIWYAGGEFDWDNVYTKHFGVDEVDSGQFNQTQEVELANFCCVLIKKEVFKSIGFLDEKYFLYWEDADFSVKAKTAGFKIRYQPQSKIWHKNSGSSGSGSILHDYYLTRNRLIFGFKFASLRTKFALVRQSAGQLVSGRPGEKQGIIDFYLKHFGKNRRI